MAGERLLCYLVLRRAGAHWIHKKTAASRMLSTVPSLSFLGPSRRPNHRIAPLQSVSGRRNLTFQLREGMNKDIRCGFAHTLKIRSHDINFLASFPREWCFGSRWPGSRVFRWRAAPRSGHEPTERIVFARQTPPIVAKNFIFLSIYINKISALMRCGSCTPSQE